jgi:hypothetical protein
MSKDPYLKLNRLQDIIAAIQVMALFQRSSAPPEGWAELISGDATKADYWRKIFVEHPEFFRRSPEKDDRYALVWRRALPRRFDRRTNRALTEEEYDSLPDKEYQYISRMPISQTDMKTLIDVAIQLHSKAIDRDRDWRWLIPHGITIVTAAVAAIGAAKYGASR